MTKQSRAAAPVEHLWQEHAPAVQRFLLRRIRSPHDADDLLQEVFLRAVRAAPADAGPAWLFTVARNVLTDHYRRAVHHREIPVAGGLDYRQEDHVDRPPGPAEAVLARCASRFLAELPEEQADALDRVHRQSIRQIRAAQQAGVSVSGMKSRVQRGRTRLRQLLEDCCRISHDARGGVLDYEPRPGKCPC